MPRPASLCLTMPPSTSAVSSTATSPADAGDVRSSLSSPASTSAENAPSAAMNPNSGGIHLPTTSSHPPEAEPSSPEITSLPPFPPSPKDTPKHTRESSKSFFSNLKASKSSSKIHTVEPTIRQVSEETPRSKVEDQDESIYSLSKQKTGSTPDLSLSNFNLNSSEDRKGGDTQALKIPRRPVGTSIGSGSSLGTSPVDATYPKKPKPRFTHILNRTLSIRMDDGGRKSKPTTPNSATSPGMPMHYDGSSDNDNINYVPRTAPLQQDHHLRDQMNSGTRNRSADRQPKIHQPADRQATERQPTNHSQENVAPRRTGNQDPSLPNTTPALFRGDGTGSHLFANIKNKGSRAAGGLGRAGLGMFSKTTRSGSSTRQEDERYVFRVLHLPLREQTRETRIAGRLEDSKDKTEFWMPSLPWRCIDFLNFRGCEEEGLYRIPGSEVQIKHWQRRFDREGDIDLFKEPELYDINIIGSMFKAWLRDLPSEILPKEVQARVAEECEVGQGVPQRFKDELSNLPPWNYYLLFAITCHLSLLITYADKNRMSYSNLCICFQPALKIDGICFQYLVQHWRECWQGCWTEEEYLEEEYRSLDGGLPSSSGESSAGSTAVGEDRSVPSSASDKPTLSGNRSQQNRPPPLSLTQASDEDLATPKTPNGNMTALPKLAPVKPLSPLMGTNEYS